MPLEGDFYRYLHSWFGNKPSRYVGVIKDKLAASGPLMRSSQLAWAIKNGIKSVVTIRESPLDPAWFPKESSIDYKHVKVQDFGAPPVEELNQVINYIDNEIQSGKPVIVHCNGGSGRTGTVLAAYLMKKEGLTADQAALKVKEIRGRTIRHQRQLDTLREYEKFLTVKT